MKRRKEKNCNKKRDEMDSVALDDLFYKGIVSWISEGPAESWSRWSSFESKLAQQVNPK